MKALANSLVLVVTCGSISLCGGIARAQLDSVDVVKLNTALTGNKQVTQHVGKIISQTATEVTIQSKKDGERTIPANEIDYVQFAGSAEIASVRAKIRDGKLEEAQNSFKSIKREKQESPAAKAEYDFANALLAVRLAQSGQGPPLKDAGRLLYAFVQANKDNYNYFPACELMGDVFASLGNSDFSDKMFAELAKAPWPEYKMRASIASGRALLAQGKAKEAINKFTEAINGAQAGSPGAEKQILAATLGKAEALALSGKGEDGLKIAEDILTKANAEDAELHARTYTTMGNCLRQLRRDKEALLAFLHVHLLYPNLADADAESLFNLSTLWEKQHRPDRANECRNLLQSKYPASRWNSKKAS